MSDTNLDMTPEEHELFEKQTEQAASMSCEAGNVLRELLGLLVTANIDAHDDKEDVSPEAYEAITGAELRLWRLATMWRAREAAQRAGVIA